MRSGVPSEEYRRGRDGRRWPLARGVAGRASGDGFRLLNAQPLARRARPLCREWSAVGGTALPRQIMWAYGVHAYGPPCSAPRPHRGAPPPAATGASMPRTAYAITPASLRELPATPSEAPHCDPHDNHHPTARAPRLRPCPWPLPLRVPPRREAFTPPSPHQPPTPFTGASPRPGPSRAGFRRPPACGQ